VGWGKFRIFVCAFKLLKFEKVKVFQVDLNLRKSEHFDNLRFITNAVME